MQRILSKLISAYPNHKGIKFCGLCINYEKPFCFTTTKLERFSLHFGNLTVGTANSLFYTIRSGHAFSSAYRGLDYGHD